MRNMTMKVSNGLRRYVADNCWLIVVDIAGALLLVSALLTAAGATALQEWMFVVLGLVPVMALVVLVPARRHRAPPPPPIRAARERTIVISPRPIDQRTGRTP